MTAAQSGLGRPPALEYALWSSPARGSSDGEGAMGIGQWANGRAPFDRINTSVRRGLSG
ncbi:hypothetical protein GCM10022254_24990 [Actinomadura meridiana]|uniref:Uncharacterized protein n=1 Tax=Actinomadura meridiana TaxID=559626 RepID=A0ABP8BY89_9ACTN